MTTAPDSPPGGDTGQSPSLLRGNLRALLVIAAATVALELGAYFLARSATSRLDALLLCLGVCTVWVCLSAGPLAAGGRDVLSALLRGGTPADASLLTLLALWALDAFAGDGARYLTFASVLMIYCTLAAVAVFAAACARVVRGAAGRFGAGVAAAVLLMIALATPLWTGGWLQATRDDQARQQVIRAAVYVNPFYSVAAGVAEKTQFVWHQSQTMYRLTRIGDYAAPPPTPWYAATVVYGCLILIVAATHLVRRR